MSSWMSFSIVERRLLNLEKVVEDFLTVLDDHSQGVTFLLERVVVLENRVKELEKIVSTVQRLESENEEQ